MRRTIALLLLATSVTACTARHYSTVDDPSGTAPKTAAAPSAGDATKPPTPPASTSGGAGGVLALVDGKPVTAAMLQRSLLEASGGSALMEYVLDRRIEQALVEKKLTLTPADLDAEKANLLATLDDDRDQATRLLSRLREERGLGPTRFDALLRRNAGLRKLIAGEVNVTEPLVRDMWEQRYGLRTEVRMILLPNLPEASKAQARAKAGENFSDLAVALSTDSSRNQGGLLPPINAQDATFPKAIRDAAAKLKPGEISEPVALDAGFAILRCERKIPAQDVPMEKVADDLRRRVRLGLERTLMQRQVRVLLEAADVTALDPTLNETWKRQRQLMLSPDAGR